MKFVTVAAALLHLAAAGHIQVKMPYLNPAGVSYVQNHEQFSIPGGFAVPTGYEAAAGIAAPHQFSYEAHNIAYQAQIPHQEYYGEQQFALKAPHAVKYAQVPVKATVAVPTVHHVPAVADVPVTKIETQPAVVQKVVDVAKPAIKTRKYEVRRPAIQKQFYDIEERTIIRPVGSALVELDEPLSKSQKGPSILSSLDGHHHEYVDDHHDHIGNHHAALAVDHGLAVTASPIPHAVAVTQPTHTVAITPAVHSHVVSTIAPSHQPIEHQYLHHDTHAYEQHFVSSTPSPLHITPVHTLVSSTPAPHFDDSIIVNAAAKNLAAAEYAAFEASLAHQEAAAHAHHEAVAHAQHEAAAHAHHEAVAHAQHEAAAHAHHEAVAHAHHEAAARAQHEAVAHAHHEAAARAHHEAVAHANLDAYHGVHTISNGAAHEPVIVKNTAHVDLKSLNHLGHNEAQENQQKLIKLLTARGGVAEVGFGHHGHSEHIGDAGFSRARVLSATPSPYHEPVEEKSKTRRIVVSRPVQTIQEIDVVEPATKIEKVAIQQPTVIKTARVGFERVHTSIPVYGKALAPAIAHAQVPVEYYH